MWLLYWRRTAWKMIWSHTWCALYQCWISNSCCLLLYHCMGPFFCMVCLFLWYYDAWFFLFQVGLWNGYWQDMHPACFKHGACFLEQYVCPAYCFLEKSPRNYGTVRVSGMFQILWWLFLGGLVATGLWNTDRMHVSLFSGTNSYYGANYFIGTVSTLVPQECTLLKVEPPKCTLFSGVNTGVSEFTDFQHNLRAFMPQAINFLISGLKCTVFWA